MNTILYWLGIFIVVFTCDLSHGGPDGSVDLQLQDLKKAEDDFVQEHSNIDLNSLPSSIVLLNPTERAHLCRKIRGEQHEALTTTRGFLDTWKLPVGFNFHEPRYMVINMLKCGHRLFIADSPRFSNCYYILYLTEGFKFPRVRSKKCIEPLPPSYQSATSAPYPASTSAPSQQPSAPPLY